MRRTWNSVALSLLLVLVGCNGNTPVLPPAVCPTITAPPPDFGPVAQPASTESVGIELNQAYMRARVQAQLEQQLPATATRQQLAIPEGQPGYIPKGGIRLNSVNLEQRGQSPSRLNLIAIGITPWIRSETGDPADASGNTFRLTAVPVGSRSFILRLQLVPHLITPATVSSLPTRQTLLGCSPGDMTCAGVLLSLAFQELYDQGFSELVVCGGSGGGPQRSPNYDFVSAQVLQGALDTVNGRVIPPSTPGGAPTVIPPVAPITIPTTGILAMVSGLANGAPVSLTGVAVGSDRDLRIGLLLDRGTPVPFTDQAGFRPNTDWGVVIDTSFLTSRVASDVTTRAAGNSPPVTIPAGGVTVDFQPGRIDITASGIATTAVLSCSVPVSLALSVTPSICRNAAGQSVLRMCPGPVRATPTATVCAFFDLLIGGSATATVTCPGCPGPPGPPDPCGPTPIQFAAGPNDTLYATAIDTGGSFYVSGRSSFMDARLASMGQARTAAPASCP